MATSGLDNEERKLSALDRVERVERCSYAHMSKLRDPVNMGVAHLPCARATYTIDLRLYRDIRSIRLAVTATYTPAKTVHNIIVVYASM